MKLLWIEDKREQSFEKLKKLIVQYVGEYNLVYPNSFDDAYKSIKNIHGFDYIILDIDMEDWYVDFSKYPEIEEKYYYKPSKDFTTEAGFFYIFNY